MEPSSVSVFFNAGCDAVGIGDVERNRGRLAPHRLDFLLQLGKTLHAPPRNGDLGPRLGENQGEALSQPAGRSGDERHLAGQIVGRQ